MQLTAGRPKIVVSADGTGLVSQAGGLLLEETLAYDGALCSEVAGPLAEASRRDPKSFPPIPEIAVPTPVARKRPRTRRRLSRLNSEPK